MIEKESSHRKSKYACVFAGSRDHYQVAWALAESGRLSKFVNEFYFSALPGWMRWLSKIANRDGRARTRSCPGIEPELVHIPPVAMICSLIYRADHSSFLTSQKDRALGRACGEIASRNRCSILSYSYYASYAFQEMPDELDKVLFQVQAHPSSVRKILAEELERTPAAKWSLMNEHELNFSPELLNRLVNEPMQADYIVTPSSYAQSTLLESGVSKNKISVVPYGISTEIYSPKQFYSRKNSEKLRLVFVGSLIQRKGVSYLMEAMRRLKNAPIELLLISRGIRDDTLLKHYGDIPYKMLWNAPKKEIVDNLTRSDIFVLPSLVESFAHVILEAMAIGLPVITTVNTAGPDLIDSGRTGFIGSIRDVDFLVEKITWFLENQDAIPTMGLACQQDAAMRTWARFRREICMALDRFEKE